MTPFIALAAVIFALALFIWWKFTNLSDLLARSESRRIKAHSDTMLEEMDKKVAVHKARTFNNSLNAAPGPGQRDYLGRRKGGGGGWR